MMYSKKVQIQRVVKVGLGFLLFTGALSAYAYDGEALAKHAKVSITQARVIALKAHPGKITDEELEKETGGSGLRYTFDIAVAGAMQEVGVDALTGNILENTSENPDEPKDLEDIKDIKR